MTDTDAVKLEMMRRLDEAFRQVRRQINMQWQLLNVHGLGMTHGRMLTILGQSGPQKATAMAEQLMITSGGVTGIADRLIELGFVERTRGEHDKRVSMLDLTDEGRKVIAMIEAARVEMMHKLFKDFTIEEMENGLQLFERMAVNMESKSAAESV